MKISAFFIAILMFAGIAAAQCVTPPAGMVSWWRAENDALDSQDGNHGTLQNGATFAAGMVGQAFSFDGVDDFVDLGNDASLNPTSQITVDAWVKFTELRRGARVISREDSPFAGVTAYVLYQYDSPVPGTFAFFVSTSAGSANVLSTDSTAYNDDQWHHVAGTYDGSAAKLYIDGVLRGSAPLTGAINTNTAKTIIGWENSLSPPSGSNDFRWKGLIDEVEIFSAAISSSEIQSIYNAGSAGKCAVAVPEFSILTLLLAVLAALAGILFVRHSAV